MGRGIFWVNGGGWTFFMGGWGCVELHFGWMGVCGQFLWVSRCGSRYIVGDRWWVDNLFGWVEAGGGGSG